MADIDESAAPAATAPEATETDATALKNQSVNGGLSKADVVHNMKVIIMLDAIFTTGIADLTMVMTPLLVYLGASSTWIGMFGSLGGLSLLGVLISPLISVHFRFKKIYLFVVHLPYIACWGIIGIVLVSSGKLGVSNAWLLMFVTVMQAVNNILGGFVMLPHQEYTAACIPMHYRGRYSAWSQGIGSISSIGSTLLGGWILYVVTKPMAFGYLFIMAWFFCQLGYVMALFARERPTPIENAPKPWTRGMFTALWRDRPFVKLMIANALYTIFFWPFFTFFINSYGFKELGMIAAMASVIMMVTNVTRIAVAGPAGILIDRLKPKRVLMWLPLLAFLAIISLLLFPNQFGVYIATGLGAVFMITQFAAFLALIYGIPKPENRSGHYTLQMVQSSLSQAIGPILMGWLSDELGFRVMFAGLAIAALLLIPLTRYLLADISDDPEQFA